MISIIIPAHNEEQVIARSVEPLSTGAEAGELEVIVVCNGCNDQTADIARRLGGTRGLVRVIESSVASKVNALNLGDAAATGFPRFFVDADVKLSITSLRQMAECLSEGNILAVAPRFQMELATCSWWVRAFYDINGRLPSSREGIGGSGVYGLSEKGRRRFDRFPDLTADDGFVRVQFKPAERATLHDCWSIVFAPKTLRELICIKTRSHFGSMELRRRFPEFWVNKGDGNGSALKKLCMRPWHWPKLAVYGYVKLVARGRAHRRLRSGDLGGWERDESSRRAQSR
jgi:glycosyltransferase involved in cell wall biosynthesis